MLLSSKQLTAVGGYGKEDTMTAYANTPYMKERQALGQAAYDETKKSYVQSYGKKEGEARFRVAQRDLKSKAIS